MKTKNILSFFFAIILVVSFIFTGCQKNAQNSQAAATDALTTMSAEDVSLLVKDFPAESLRQFADPEQKKELLDDLKTMLAIAAEARRNNIAAEPEIKEQLDFFSKSVVASEFDRQSRPAESRNAPSPPFADVKPEEVEAFYKEPGVEAKYNSFLELVKKRAAAARPGSAPTDLTEDQIKQIRDGFAKVSITERKAVAAGFDKERKTQLAVQLQQATFLAQEYSRRNEQQFSVTDAEVADYVKQHPELDPAKKREVAEQVLQRAKAGEDFGKLAKEFSEDPGSKDKGGLYEDVKKGQFVPEFETAAFALEKGQIADKLVESKFGFHIIKLEKKAADSFSVRHILLMTTAQNPANPLAPPMTMDEQAREAIKKQKRDKWIEEVVAKNNIKLPSADEIKIEAPPAAPAPAPALEMPAPGAQTAPPVEEKKQDKK
jgi:parvulin-like peptidyl-prolyl isomerase